MHGEILLNCKEKQSLLVKKNGTGNIILDEEPRFRKKNVACSHLYVDPRSSF